MAIEVALESPFLLLRVGEAARMVHVHPNTLRRWSDQGLIRCFRVGYRKDRRFALSDLVKLLDWYRETTPWSVEDGGACQEWQWSTCYGATPTTADCWWEGRTEDEITTSNELGQLLRVGEAAELLHIAQTTLRKWSDQGLIPCYPLGRWGDRRFSKTDLEGFLTSRRKGDAGQRGCA